MSFEINVLYAKARKLAPIPMAAQEERELIPGKLNLKSLETDLLNLIKMLTKLENEDTKYGIDEVKFGVGISEDSEGKIRVGISASILNILRGEAYGETGTKTSQNQLFEITIRKKK